MKLEGLQFLGPRSNGRMVALQVLLACRTGDAFIQDVLDQALTRTSLASADRRLATQLAYGVLRRRGSLDALLSVVVSRPAHQVEPWIWDTLRLGAYQLALLTQIPAHAALHETVELAGSLGRADAKGFINGVLRRLASLVTDDRSDKPGADALPLEQGQYRRLAQAVLPDPTAEPVQYLAAAFSLPVWLALRWHQRHDGDECRRRGFWFAGPAPLWLRVNPLRADRAVFLADLAERGIAAEAGAHPQSVRLNESLPIRDLPGYDQGWFAVQDISAMNVASALAPAPGSRVLDLCAAPGGKTTHLAELMNNRGQIVACDVDERRLKSVGELTRRLGIGIVRTVRLDPEGAVHPDGPFDAALVDAPCTNTGVLGRRPEARWRLKPDEIGHLARLQITLLSEAFERVRPGGAIVYSTCSVEAEENRQVVDEVLRTRPGLKLEADAEHVPGRPGDGGYWARLRRTC